MAGATLAGLVVVLTCIVGGNAENEAKHPFGGTSCLWRLQKK